MMKKKSIVAIIFLFLLAFSCGQPRKLKDSASIIRSMMQEYAPCHPGWYCYEYEFELVNKKCLITTRRYNYQDNEEQKYLALTTIYTIPLQEISSIEKFPTTDDSILIKTEGEKIELAIDGEMTKMDYMALDFNQLFAYDDQLPILINELQKIVNYYQEVP
jgi:hypothetical protein